MTGLSKTILTIMVEKDIDINIHIFIDQNDIEKAVELINYLDNEIYEQFDFVENPFAIHNEIQQELDNHSINAEVFMDIDSLVVKI